MDKELQPHAPPFTAAAFMPYRAGGETPFSAPLPMPPYPFALPRPELDRRLALLNSGLHPGAFRQLGDSSDSPQAYHSAFSLAASVASTSTSSSAKKHKLDDGDNYAPQSSSPCSSTAENAHAYHSGRETSNSYPDEHRNDQHESSPRRDVIKEERPSSLCSSQGGYETVSDGPAMSDSGDTYERGAGTPDSEGRALRRQRKRISHDGSSSCCPVCGLTLRAGELGAHLMLEVEKLDKLTRGGGRKSRDTTPLGRKTLLSPSSSKKGKDSPPPEVTSRARYDAFLRIRCNRQARLSARRGQKKRRPDEDGLRETPCPVCNERLSGSTEELNAHVEQCLKQQRGSTEEEEPVDVEGEFEEYEWAGQTRVRATSLLEGGFAASGFQVGKRGSDDDAELNVDGDDSEEYGKPQFSERDMVPLPPNGEGSPDPSFESTSFTAFASEKSFSSRTDIVNADGAGPSTSYQACDLSNCDNENQSTSSLVSALKLKLRDLEAEKAERQKCLICMEPYKMPLTSIQCWHVHCENCWMRTLGAKKLCPQCNMITSPADLRRIYL